MSIDSYAISIILAKKFQLKSDEIIFIQDLLAMDNTMRSAEHVDYLKSDIHVYSYGEFDPDVDQAFIFLESLQLTNLTDDTVVLDIVNRLKSKNIIYVSGVLEKEIVALNWGTLDVD